MRGIWPLPLPELVEGRVPPSMPGPRPSGQPFVTGEGVMSQEQPSIGQVGKAHQVRKRRIGLACFFVDKNGFSDGLR